MKNGIVNWKTYGFPNFRNDGRERSDLPSLTIPGQVRPLDELLKMYTRGQDVETHQPVYNGDTEFPDVSRLSTLDRLDLSREVGQQIESMRAKRPAKITDVFDPIRAPKTDPAPGDVVDGG